MILDILFSSSVCCACVCLKDGRFSVKDNQLLERNKWCSYTLLQNQQHHRKDDVLLFHHHQLFFFFFENPTSPSCKHTHTHTKNGGIISTCNEDNKIWLSFFFPPFIQRPKAKKKRKWKKKERKKRHSGFPCCLLCVCVCVVSGGVLIAPSKSPQ